MAAADKKAPASAPPAKRGGKLPLIIAGVAVLPAGGPGARWSPTSRKPAEAEAAAIEAAKPKLPAPAQYLALEPPFVVNLDSGTAGPRYLQVEIQLMTRDAASLADLERHAPAIRARLLMLLAQQTSESIADRSGKEKLQGQALTEVQKLMQTETGKPAAEALLFTSFVTQ